MSLAFDPYVPLALWLPLAAAAAALLGLYAVRSRGRIAGRRAAVTWGLMALAVALPLGILLNPTWVETLPPPPGKPLLTVLLDDSSSMATRDVDGKPRLERGRELAAQVWQRLGQRYDVALRTFSDGTQAASVESFGALEPDGAATDLASAIGESLEDRVNGQALLVLSDGAHNAGPVSRVREVLEQTRTFATPVFTVPLGGAGDVRDLEVRVNVPQEVAFVRQETPISVVLQQRGALADRVQLTLMLGDERISRQEVALAANEIREIAVPLRRDHKGLYRFEVHVDPIEGEATVLNNSAPLVLRVIDEPVQVLLLEGKPYWDSKFLVRTLANDESIELTSVVRLTDTRFWRRKIARQAGAGGDDRPLRSEESSLEPSGDKLLEKPETLARFQVVLLGRDAEVFLGERAVEALRTWLTERGGALVCARGAPVSQLSKRLAGLMPVRWAPGAVHRYRVQLTKSGESLPWLAAGASQDALENLPSLAGAEQPEKPQPLAVVLASSAGAPEGQTPVLSYQPVGSGRVVVVEGSGMWRWAFLPPQHQSHDETYRAFWRNLVRWLVSSAELLPSQALALRSDKLTFSTAEPCSATLLLRDPGAKPPLVALSGGLLPAPQRVEPVPSGEAAGQFRVQFGRLPEGQYRAGLEGVDPAESAAQTIFDVRGPLRERLDVAARPDLLKMIAESSGGQTLTATNLVDELARSIDDHLAAALPRRTQRITAWDRWWVLTALLALWSGSWAWRRSSGLI